MRDGLAWWWFLLLGGILAVEGYAYLVHEFHWKHNSVAQGLAAYQIASATIDWLMWIIMKEEGIFSNPLAQTMVIAAIASHYLLGILLFMGINKARGTAS